MDGGDLAGHRHPGQYGGPLPQPLVTSLEVDRMMFISHNLRFRKKMKLTWMNYLTLRMTAREKYFYRYSI